MGNSVQVGYALLGSKNKLAWMEGLLTEKFFVDYGTHDSARKNEKNIYCLDCCKSSCPLPKDNRVHPPGYLGKMFVHNDDHILLKVIIYATPSSVNADYVDPDSKFVHKWEHHAGPRTKIFFHPDEVKETIVTCGGLCPGLNDVIRQIVITLQIYGVKNIVSISYGYHGLFDENLPEIPLSRKVVQNIHLSGGSLLGVSRGGGNVSEIVDSM